MADNTSIDDEAIGRLDRAWMGATEGIMWPLAIAESVEPRSAMSAWARAGARDPRCLWWVLARFGAEAVVDAASGLDEADRLAAMRWMNLQALNVWIEDQPATVTEDGWRYKPGPGGSHIWESGGKG